MVFYSNNNGNRYFVQLCCCCCCHKKVVRDVGLHWHKRYMGVGQSDPRVRQQYHDIVCKNRHLLLSFSACGRITPPVSYGKYVLSNNGLTISEKCSDGFTETSVDMYACTEDGWMKIRNKSACGPLGKLCFIYYSLPILRFSHIPQ